MRRAVDERVHRRLEIGGDDGFEPAARDERAPGARPRRARSRLAAGRRAEAAADADGERRRLGRCLAGAELLVLHEQRDVGEALTAPRARWRPRSARPARTACLRSARLSSAIRSSAFLSSVASASGTRKSRTLRSTTSSGIGPVRPEEHGEIDLLLPELPHGALDLLLRAHGLLLDAGELPFVDHARVADAVDLDRLLERGGHLPRELEARLSSCRLHVLHLRLRDDDALGVGPAVARGLERALARRPPGAAACA